MRALIIGLLLLITAAVFWQVQEGGFVFDDSQYIVQNRHLRQGLTAETVKWAFTTYHMTNWHPLTWISHLADATIFGLDPRGHHFVNLLLHCANAALLFLLLQGMTGALWRSAVAAALFAVHPLHVESVAWISERKDLLSTFFGLLAMISYARYARRRGKPLYLLTALLFSFSLLSKPMLVTLPFVLLIFDFWPLARSDSLRFLILEKIPLLALSAASSAVTYVAQSRGGAVTDIVLYPLWARVLNALSSYAVYIGKMFWPWKLAVYYPHAGTSIAVWPAVGAGIALAAASFLAVSLRKRAPYLAAGWFFYLGTLVPVIGLVQVGTQSHADRYTYMPLTGLFIVLAWGCWDLSARWRRRRAVAAALAAVTLVSLSVLTWRQVGYWETPLSLYGRALEVTSGNWLVHNNLGLVHYEKGRVDKAIEHYSEALKIKPNYPHAHNNLGVALSDSGFDERARHHYREAIRLLPEFAEAHGNLAFLLARQGRIDEAIIHFRESLRLDPDYAEGHRYLALAYVMRGDFRNAAEHYRRSLEIRPGDPETLLGLGTALWRVGDRPAARAQYEALLKIDPARARRLLSIMQGR